VIGDRSPVRRALAWSGVAAVLVGFGTIVVTTASAPWFDWTANALSHLGDSDRWALAWVFNRGLTLAGVLGSAFVARVAVDATTNARRGAIGVFGISTVSLALIGAFPVGNPLHGPVSVAFFVSLTYGVFLWGTTDVLDDQPRHGLALIWLGIGHVTLWATWVTVVPWSGIAIPELVGALVLGAWAIAVTRDLQTPR